MNKWIRCGDGIPLPNISVLVVDEFGDVFISAWDYYEGWNSITKITHWQALPEPPEEE